MSRRIARLFADPGLAEAARPHLFFQWLVAAALADWLITRTLTRLAIHMPKSPPILAAYQVLTWVGQWASTLAGLLALIVAAWLVRHHLRRAPALALVLLGVIALNLLFLVIPPSGWLAVAGHGLVIIAVVMMGCAAWREMGVLKQRLAWAAPALALIAGALHQLGPALLRALRQPGPPPLAIALFNFGELLVVITPLIVWWAFVGERGETKSPGLAYVWAALPAAAFITARILDPAMTGILAIWSVGLTLYLPWPLYAVSLWLAGASILLLWRNAPTVGGALLLLAAGGYAPQLSHQLFLNLIGLWLLTQPVGPAVSASAQAFLQSPKASAASPAP